MVGIVVASPEELNQWLQRISGEAAGVHVVTPGSESLERPAGLCSRGGGAKDSLRVSNLGRTQHV